MKYRKYLLSPVLLVVAALAIASLGRTEEASRYSGNDWATLDLKQVQAAAAEINLTKLPDCDEAVVDSKTMCVVHEDGTAEMQYETFTKVLTEKGKRNNNTLSGGS
jgi:hypothetical protein